MICLDKFRLDSPVRKNALIALKNGKRVVIGTSGLPGSAISILIVNFQPIVFHNHFDIPLLKWGAFPAFFGTILPPELFAIAMPKIGATTSSHLMTIELPMYWLPICS